MIDVGDFNQQRRFLRSTPEDVERFEVECSNIFHITQLPAGLVEFAMTVGLGRLKSRFSFSKSRDFTITSFYLLAPTGADSELRNLGDASRTEDSIIDATRSHLSNWARALGENPLYGLLNIGDDRVGGDYFISCRDDDFGTVYFYQSEEYVLHRVAGSFTEFVEGLEPWTAEQ